MKDTLREEKLRRFVIALTNIGVLLLVVLALSIAVWIYLKPKDEIHFTTGLHRGEKFKSAPMAVAGNPVRTLLIVIDPMGYDSNESARLYRELTDVSCKDKTTVRAIFSGDESAAEEYMTRNQVWMDSASSVKFGVNNIDGAPAIILLDADGTILDFWLGKLSNDDERQVINAISESSKTTQPDANL